MSEPHDDDRLSAYWDDELSPAERRQIDEWLAADPAPRQLLDDFQRVRAELSALGSQRLPADFPARVRAQAERETLAGEPVGAPNVGASQGRLSPAAGWPWSRMARPLIWSGAAVAAALALMALDPSSEFPTSDSLALRESGAPAAAYQAAAAASAAGRGARQVEAPGADDRQSGRLASSETDGAALGVTIEAADESASPPAAEARYPADTLSKGAPASPMGREKAIVRHLGRTPPAAEPAANEVCAPAAAGIAGELPLQHPLAPASPAEVGFPIEPSAVRLTAAESGVLVVQCDLSSEAAESGAFEALLARQQISWIPLPELATQIETPPLVHEADSPPTDTAPSAPAAPVEEGNLPSVEAIVETPPAAPAIQPESDAPSDAGAAAVPAVAPEPSSDVDVVYVEATEAQLAGTLAALRDQPRQYPNVAVLPAPGNAEQQNFTQYNRLADGPSLPNVSSVAASAAALVTGAQNAAGVPRAQRVLSLRRGRIVSQVPQGQPELITPSSDQGLPPAAAPTGGDLQRALFVLRVLGSEDSGPAAQTPR